MNGFRIWVPADNELHLHTKRHTSSWAKTVLLLVPGISLILLMAGCGKRTPTYAGPPDTVRSIVMKKWAIVPNRLVIPQGAKVELVVSTADVEHGIDIPGLGIREPVQNGQPPAVIRFLAQTPGVYPMRCSIACGRGHDKMTGAIVITPASPTAPAAH